MKSSDVPVELYPIVIVQDRYQGIYAGGEWIAISGDHFNEVTEVVWGSDGEAMGFVRLSVEKWVAVGDTPNEALERLMKKNKPPSIVSHQNHQQ